LDVAARVFARAGSRAGLLRLGPVVAVWQSPPEESTWNVPIEDPRDPSRTLLHIRVANRNLAIAGRLETDVSSVLDPRTGDPAASDLLAVLTVADSAAGASALSSALYVMGSRASGDLLGRMHRAEAVMLVASEGGPTLLASASLKGRLELSADLKAELSGNVRYLLPPQSIEVELP
jgi:thiamine biosynthesis lipoprotein